MTKHCTTDAGQRARAESPAATAAALPVEAQRKLAAFEALIRKWNGYCRLVSKSDVRRLRERHILDSLALLPWWHGRLVDLGTGAGLPGVPLAIARPATPVALVERSVRKSWFLRQAIIDLHLDNVELVVADAAGYHPERQFDTATARAVTSPPKAWRLMRRFLVADGVGLLQLREPLTGDCLDGGEVADSVRVDRESWIAIVRRCAG